MDWKFVIDLRRTANSSNQETKPSRRSPLIVLVLAIGLAVTPARQSFAAEDKAAPRLVEFSISPALVDTSGGSATITLTARITDDLAGFSFGNTTFSSPSGSQSLAAAFLDTDRVSGTSLDGVYQRSVTIPRFSEQGAWASLGFSLKDQANNLRDLSRSDLTAGGFPTSFQQTGAGETAAPRLVEFSISPALVDTSGGSATITLTARITDDLAGFGFGNTTFSSPSGSQSLATPFFDTDRVSGTSLDGVYQRSVTIPRFSEQGAWASLGFSLKDQANNLRDLSRSDLTAGGFPTSFQQTGAGETAAPRLVEFSISPAVVDTSGGSATIILTARITDDLAGFGFGNTTFSSPSGSQSLATPFFDTDRVSGTSLDGVYQRSVTIPRFSEQGAWASLGFSLKDQANNLRDLSRSDLTAGGFPTGFDNGQLSDLSITELASPNPVLVGGTLAYTVEVVNGGRVTATDVTVTDTLPMGVSFVAAKPSQGSCGRSAGVVTCSLGQLEVGGGATVTIKGIATAKGTITNTAAVRSATVDPDPTNNSASVTTDVLALIGAAFGERIDVDVSPRAVRFGPAPSVSLPPGGGEAKHDSVARLQVLPVVRAGIVHVMARGGQSGRDIVVTSSAGVAETNIGDGIVVAEGIESACRADLRGAQGSARIAKLVISGRPVTVPPRSNTTIDIAGVGVLLLNQQTTDAFGVLTVNALRLKLDGGSLTTGDITLAQSRCGVES